MNYDKNKSMVLGAEFLGTAMLAMAAMLGGAPLAGLTLAMLVLVFGGISGTHINPAVTLGLWSIKKINTQQAVMYIAAQLAGGLTAFGFFSYFTYLKLTKVSGIDSKIFLAEMIGTVVFTFGIAAAVHALENNLEKAVAIGTSLFLGATVAGVVAKGFLNPAVMLGNGHLCLSYILAPVIGAVVGMNLHMLIFGGKVKK
jgi:aquaporin Z